MSIASCEVRQATTAATRAVGVGDGDGDGDGDTDGVAMVATGAGDRPDAVNASGAADDGEGLGAVDPQLAAITAASSRAAAVRRAGRPCDPLCIDPPSGRGRYGRPPTSSRKSISPAK